MTLHLRFLVLHSALKFISTLTNSLLRAAVRIKWHNMSSKSAHKRSLPVGKYLTLTVDDVPSHGAEETYKIIKALSSKQKKYVIN